MKKLRILWFAVVILFVLLQFYNLFRENYFDVIVSLFTIVIFLLMVGVYYLIVRNRKK